MLPATDLAADSRSLDRLRNQATQEPAAAGKEAARQFEALFMQSLIKSMRDAMPKSGMFGGQETETYTAMLDQQLSQTFAGRPGGLAESIARQIEKLTAKTKAPGKLDGAAGTQAGGAAPGGAVAGGPNAGGANSAGANAAGTDAAKALRNGTAKGSSNAPGAAPLTLPAAGRAMAPTTLDRKRFAAGITGAAAAPAVSAAPAAPNAPTAANNLAGAAAPAATPLTMAQKAFVEKLRQPALAAQRSTGIPADFIIAQAALETGWGRREILQPDGTPSRNLFGMKAGAGWTGATVASTTTEYTGGKASRQVGNFRAYSSYADSINDWARLMSGSERYSAVVRDGRTAEGFAEGLQKAGYATDPNYAQKLTKMIGKTVALKNAASRPI